MLTKLTTTIFEMYFLTHKQKFRLLTQLRVKISNVEIHNLWKLLFLLVPHSAVYYEFCHTAVLEFNLLNLKF